jgi:hypothetical protein
VLFILSLPIVFLLLYLEDQQFKNNGVKGGHRGALPVAASLGLMPAVARFGRQRCHVQ